MCGPHPTTYGLQKQHEAYLLPTLHLINQSSPIRHTALCVNAFCGSKQTHRLSCSLVVIDRCIMVCFDGCDPVFTCSCSCSSSSTAAACQASTQRWRRHLASIETDASCQALMTVTECSLAVAAAAAQQQYFRLRHKGCTDTEQPSKPPYLRPDSRTAPCNKLSVNVAKAMTTYAVMTPQLWQQHSAALAIVKATVVQATAAYAIATCKQQHSLSNMMTTS